MCAGKNFNFAERAAAAQAAHRAIGETFARLRDRNDANDPATIAWTEAIARFHAAITAAYPEHFWQDVERLKAASRRPVAGAGLGRALNSGDLKALEGAIRFVEADPIFFRSGYVKAVLVRILKRMPLTDQQRQRLGQAALNIVDRRATQEFRRYCRLATAVASEDMLRALKERAAGEDARIARRAKWMLPYVERGLRRDPKNERIE